MRQDDHEPVDRRFDSVDGERDSGGDDRAAGDDDRATGDGHDSSGRRRRARTQGGGRRARTKDGGGRRARTQDGVVSGERDSALHADGDGRGTEGAGIDGRGIDGRGVDGAAVDGREAANDAIPQAIGDVASAPVGERLIEPTGEVSMLPPEEASKVAAEIRAVAEMRGQDFVAAELAELQKTGPLPIIAEPIDDDALSADELRDAWPLLDLEERSDGLRVLPREDAEDYFIGLSASDQIGRASCRERV